MNTDKLQIDLQKAILALSDALDILGNDKAQHGKRVGYIAAQCAHQLGYEQKIVSKCFNMGLLHDIGVSKTLEMGKLLDNVNPDQVMNIMTHCKRGHALLKNFGPFANLADAVLHHHTPWMELQKLGLDKETAILANLIHMADRIDATLQNTSNTVYLIKANQTYDYLKSARGVDFDSSLVDAFLEISKQQAFWMRMEPRHLGHFIEEMGSQAQSVKIGIGQIKHLARMFSEIVDAKSPFTAEHSHGVAKLAHWIGKQLQLSPLDCEKLELAGYFHDLGKLRVPDEILDKPDKLSLDEEAVMKYHPFDTYEILRRIPGIEDIAMWASNHHETLDQKGYPFLWDRDAICIKSRILAVADVFQALVQKRPYRDAMAIPEAIKIMDTLVDEKRLDEALVGLIKQNVEACLIAATSTPMDIAAA